MIIWTCCTSWAYQVAASTPSRPSSQCHSTLDLGSDIRLSKRRRWPRSRRGGNGVWGEEQQEAPAANCVGYAVWIWCITTSAVAAAIGLGISFERRLFQPQKPQAQTFIAGLWPSPSTFLSPVHPLSIDMFHDCSGPVLVFSVRSTHCAECSHVAFATSRLMELPLLAVAPHLNLHSMGRGWAGLTTPLALMPSAPWSALAAKRQRKKPREPKALEPRTLRPGFNRQDAQPGK